MTMITQSLVTPRVRNVAPRLYPKISPNPYVQLRQQTRQNSNWEFREESIPKIRPVP